MATANRVEFLLIAEMGKGLNSLIQIRNLPGHYISWFSLSSKSEVFSVFLIIFFIRIAHICVTVSKEYVKDDYDGGDTVRLYPLDGKCNISGERIKSARAKAKLTQDQLAARLQVAACKWAKWQSAELKAVNALSLTLSFLSLRKH